MSPDPEPPTPVVQSFDVEISNSLNNAYMLLLYTYKPNSRATVLIGGGKATIGEWNDLGNFEVPTDIIQLWVYSKAYDNTHPDYDDEYYSDSTRKAIIDMSDLDGKTAKIISNGSSNATVNIE